VGVQGGSNENDYDVLAVDLGTERATPTKVYEASDGVLLSTTVVGLDGTCSIGFNSGSRPLVPLSTLTYPQTICFIFSHGSVWVQNTTQTGKTLTLWLGRSV